MLVHQLEQGFGVLREFFANQGGKRRGDGAADIGQSQPDGLAAEVEAKKSLFPPKAGGKPRERHYTHAMILEQFIIREGVMVFGAFWLVVLVGLFLMALSVRVIKQYQQGLVLTLGRYTSTRGPGLNIILPVVQTLTMVDMRVMVQEVEPQDVITSDNVTVRVTAVVYSKVLDARKALFDVANYRNAISQLAQVTLRSTLGAHTLDELLRHQATLKDDIRSHLDERTEAWGVEVQNVEIRSIDLDAGMIRAMAQEAEAERGRRARIITAQGELAAAEQLAAAAKLLDASPGALMLRTLSTLKEIGAEQNSTIIAFPMPMANGIIPAVTAALGKSGA